MAITISLDYAAFSDLQPNTVIRKLKDDNFKRTIYLAQRKTGKLNPEAFIFKDFIIDWLKKHKEELFVWDE